MKNNVLILGSAPDAVTVRKMDLSSFSAIVAINNAWKIQSNWTHSIYPDDMEVDRLPPETTDKVAVTSDSFVPANNAFGGIVYAGGTMAFTTGYWALANLKPDTLAFLGCDMVYDEKASHFYGMGEADPLRDDPTLQVLEAKANRLQWFALQQKAVCVNLSKKRSSRLTFPRHTIENLENPTPPIPKLSAAQAALKLEKDADNFVPSGDYWNHLALINPTALLEIDERWLQVFETPKG